MGRPREGVAGGAAAQGRRALRAGQGAADQGVRALLRGRRRRRHRLADGVPGAAARGLLGARLPASTTTSPSSTRCRSSTCGPRRATRRGCTGSPARRGCATSTSSATAAGPANFDYGVDHATYRPRKAARRARHRRLLRPRVDAPARGRARHPRAARAAPPPARRAHRHVRQPRAAGRAVPLRARRHRRAGRAGAGCTPRAPSGSACR